MSSASDSRNPSADLSDAWPLGAPVPTPGRRRKQDATVTSLVDEIVGMTAYMQIDVLDHLSGEGMRFRQRRSMSSLLR